MFIMKKSFYSKDQILEYFLRINYPLHLNTAPSLDNLTEIFEHHQQTIPAGSLNFINTKNSSNYEFKPISIEPQEVFNKMVSLRREGHCLEHSVLLDGILTGLGYNCFITCSRPVDSELYINQGNIHLKKLTHSFNVVIIEGIQYIVDAGYGLMGSTKPVEITTTILTNFTHRTKISKSGLKDSNFYLERKSLSSPQNWIPLYNFDIIPYTWKDLDPINLYTNFHPDSYFRNNLVISRLTNNGYILIKDDSLIIKINHNVTKKTLDSYEELHQVLLSGFELDLNHIFT